MKGFRAYMAGYVRVRLRGRAPERFLNLCSAGGLEIWGVEALQDELRFFIRLCDLRACRPYARKAGVYLRIQGRYGLPFFLHRNRGRKLWAVGLVSFFLVLYSLSFFLWDIEYQGNRRYTDDELG